MTYDPPFIPESRRNDESLHGHIARARRARDDTAGRVRKRRGGSESSDRPHRTGEPWKFGTWRANGGQIILPMDRPRVL